MSGFGIGSVLGTAWRVWRRNLLPFTVLAAVLHVPTLLLRVNVADVNTPLYAMALSLVFAAMVAAAVTYGVVRELDGSQPSFRDCIVHGLAQLPRAIGASLLSFVLICLAAVLLVIPGVIAFFALFVVVPVAVIERLSPTNAMRRSRQLTDGHKGELLAIWLVCAIASGVITYGARESFSPDVFAYTATLIDVLWSSFSAVLAAVAYTLLRHEKDGTTVPEIATAFARFTPPR